MPTNKHLKAHLKTYKTAQEGIDIMFVEACKIGHIDYMKELYREYPPKNVNKSIFSNFLGLSKYFKVAINPHYQNNLPFKEACRNGHNQIIDFLINIPGFVDKINSEESREVITDELSTALSNGNVNLAKKILPLCKKRTELFYLSINEGFLNACTNDKLETLKYLFSEKTIEQQVNSIATQPQGFIRACSAGNLEIVKYFTSFPQFSANFDIASINRNISIKNIEIMRHFIFDLDMDRNHPLIDKINFNDDAALNDLFEKKDLFKELNSNLKHIPNSSDSTFKKKLKI